MTTSTRLRAASLVMSALMWVLTVLSERWSSSVISVLVRPATIRSRTASSRGVNASTGRAAVPAWNAAKVCEQSRSHRRGDERIALGSGPDSAGEQVRVGVLEQEAAGPGPECVVDVFVLVEGGDRRSRELDPRPPAQRPGVWPRCRRGGASGYRRGRRPDAVRAPVPRLPARRVLGRPPRSKGRRRGWWRVRSRTMSWSSAISTRHRGCGVHDRGPFGLGSGRNRGLDGPATLRIRPGSDLAAQQREALTHPGQSVGGAGPSPAARHWPAARRRGPAAAPSTRPGRG